MTDINAMEEVIRNSMVCRLAMCGNGRPYMVPLCFGYEPGRLFFHSAQEGKKLDILKINPAVCFEFDVGVAVIEGKGPCNWGMRFKSVIGTGRAYFVEDPAEKSRALDLITRQYGGRQAVFPEKSLAATAVIGVEIEQMTGKKAGY